MRLVLNIIFLLFIWSNLNAQPPVKSEESIHWYYNLEEAKHDATQYNKKLIIYFSGSDWCKPCIQLRKKIINTKAWIDFAEEHLVIVLADFPRLKKNQPSKDQLKYNEALAEVYNKQGVFPLIVMLDASGKSTSNLTYKEESPQEFIVRIKGLLNN